MGGAAGGGFGVGFGVVSATAGDSMAYSGKVETR